jgi:hypothetical protein
MLLCNRLDVSKLQLDSVIARFVKKRAQGKPYITHGRK